MNKKEVLELKKRFKKDETTITRVCGCYVDGEKNIISRLNNRFLNLEDEDFFKYLEIAKKSLSGKLGNNLHNIEFSRAAEENGGNQQMLLALRDSDLLNEDMLTSFYEHIIDVYCHTGNYLILLFLDNYDVMTKTSDNMKLDESEEVYKYIICSICPVDLSKAALGYKEDEKKITSRNRDWVVGAPESAFLFPAFNDRSTDIHSSLFYTKKTTDIHTELIEDLFGGDSVVSYDEKREKFRECIESLDSSDIEVTDCLLDIYSNISNQAEENGCDIEDFKLSDDTLKKALLDNDISSKDADKIIEECKSVCSSDELVGADIVDDKLLKKNELYIAYKELLAENKKLREQLASFQ